MDAIYFGWSITAFAFGMACVLTARTWWKWRSDRLEFLYANAIDHYIETGEKTAAFRSVPSRYLKATEQKRTQRVRERVAEHKVFETVCFCPSCNDLNLHYFTTNPDKSDYIFAPNAVSRECRNCGFTWRETNGSISENSH